MRAFGLLLLPILCSGLPQPQTGVSSDDITAKSGSSYDQNTPTVNPDLIKELFGSSGSHLNENYNPPKKENIKVDTTYEDCAFYAEDGYKCVNYELCDDEGEIITDGGPGLINLRGNFGPVISLDPDNSKCQRDVDVCCRHPDYIGPLKPKKLPYTSRCGTRNSEGIGLRIQSDRYQNSDTQFGEFPYMCAILEERTINDKVQNLFVAGSSLIAPDVIMTAAHSVRNYTNAKLKVRCGEWDTQTKDEPLEHQDRYVLTITLHPGYSPKNISNDIALLFMEEPFELDRHIDVVCLPNLAEMQDSYQTEGCIATGWGKDRFGESGVYQTILKKVELDLLDPYNCQLALRDTELGEDFNLDPTFTCAGGNANTDTCKGDGGGPLICPNGRNNGYGPQYVQAGIVAWGVGCGRKDVPGVYTDVADMLCFIDWATRCQKGDQDNYYGIEITGCRHWATRERSRLRNIRDAYKYQKDNAEDRKFKRKLNKRLIIHREAAKLYDNAIKQCKFDIEEEYTDFNDYDDDLDLSGYQRIGNNLSRKSAILRGKKD